MSLKKAREQLLYALDERLITEEEFLLLYDVNRSTNLDFPYEQYKLFYLDDMQRIYSPLSRLATHMNTFKCFSPFILMPDLKLNVIIYQN